MHMAKPLYIEDNHIGAKTLLSIDLIICRAKQTSQPATMHEVLVGHSPTVGPTQLNQRPLAPLSEARK